MLPLISTPKEECVSSPVFRGEKKVSLRKNDPEETDVLMSEMTLQEPPLAFARSRSLRGHVDLDLGNARGTPRPFNQWLETSLLLV